MADEIHDEELLLTDTIEGGEGDDTLAAGEPLDEIEYPDTLDDEPDPAQETPLIKQMREKAKEDARKLREAQREIEAMRNRKVPVRTAKPSMETCDYDEDRLADELLAWKDNERKVDEFETSPAMPRNDVAEKWQTELQTYKTNAVKLGKPDFEAAESAVTSILNDAQQVTIVKAAKDPARFVYALGRSPMRLAQLAEISDPIKLAAEVARIEGARVMARKEPPSIDTPLRGNARLSSGTANAAEDKLLAEAERTGDLTKLRAYRRDQRAKAA